MDVKNEDQAEQTTMQRLGNLLKTLNIKEAYYIDDYNKIDNLPYLQTVVKTLFNQEKIEEINQIFDGKLNTQVPSEDELGVEFSQLWDKLEAPGKGQILTKIYAVQQQEFNSLDFARTLELEKHFPNNVLKLVSPDEWPDLFDKLSQEYNGEEKVLILFDQDLSMAQRDRFRNKTTQGQHLILEIKGSNIRENVFCALITHLIKDTSKELESRNKIIKEIDDKLSKTDFLALSKERISDPELFCDGIKKTLLNGFFEEIKKSSREIILKAQSESLEQFDKLDTYDFDHTILRSSFNEGVWEANTIFRITDNFFEEEVKSLMISNHYPKTINPILKISKSVSDILFKVPNTNPYVEKYRLRHNDIYDLGKTINELHSPIENGDIFQVSEGTGKGFYILIAQECDLMMRNNGSRSSKFATLAKINIVPREQLVTDLSNSNHYLANKFKLDYFQTGTTNVGIVLFLTTFSVDYNMLDLCVFNTDGESTLNTKTKFDTDLLSTSWENRYNKIKRDCTSEASKLDLLLAEMGKLNLKAEIKNPILKKLYPNFGISAPLGKPVTYESNVFSFGFKRVLRLKSFGAKYLLERYYRHLSRTAEPHDFAE